MCLEGSRGIFRRSIGRVSAPIHSIVFHNSRRARLTSISRDVTPPSGLTSSAAASYTWVWNKTENWCSLCLEPLNTWNDHRGKRDHICLEMFYNALVRYGRRWTPATLWWEVERCALLRRSSPPWTRTDAAPLSGTSGDNSPFAFLDYVDAPTSRRSNLSALMKYYDRSAHYQRRLELFSCLQCLVQNGIVRVDRASLGGGASFHGTTVMFKEIIPNVVSIFPHADAKEISSLTQMISSVYNSETVFDLCNFGALCPDMQDSNATTSSAVFHEETLGDETSLQDFVEDKVSYHLKGVFCRGVMGQLRWALEPDNLACPLYRTKYTAGGGHRHQLADDLYWQVLAEHTCRALLAEMVFCRISEYVVRVEGVWRRLGQEMIKDLHISTYGRDDVEELQRLASNWGMVKYMDDYFYDEKFGDRLGNEGTPKRKRLGLRKATGVE